MKDATLKLRLDKYLWSIRLFKTRQQASEAIDGGKVKCNGQNVKPSKTVKAGEEYDVKTEGRRWLIRVTALLHHRVAYSEAINYYEDLTPEEERNPAKQQASSFHTGKRLSKIGRPTKKQRRNRDEAFGLLED